MVPLENQKVCWKIFFIELFWLFWFECISPNSNDGNLIFKTSVLGSGAFWQVSAYERELLPP
jgi:hypothetical protein